MAETAIVWFRRDLRLADQPALASAIADGCRVVPVYLHAPGEEGEWAPGGASRWWLHHSLSALESSLRQRGCGLVLRAGDRCDQLLDALIADTGATAVYWNRLYEPAAMARDRLIKTSLRERGLRVQSHAASMLHEPWTLRTGADEVYRVFTPYWRKARASLQLAQALPAPTRLDPLPHGLTSVPLEQLGLLPRIPWDREFPEHWRPGEAGAHEALELFTESALEHYANGRDRPDLQGTSRLSPHLHFGELSPAQVIRGVLGAEATSDPKHPAWATAEPFVRELGWRDFNRQLLFHFPHTPDAPLYPQWSSFEWRESAADLKAWQTGRTGIPIIDAGLRQLWRTGWMHNRVRMLVASFLTKNLRLHWLHGARWFWDTLVDADLANNTGGWQWSAGCGADAAPYFRVFNPVTQGLKFDAEGNYVRRWVPELAHLDAKSIHQPWLVGGVKAYPLRPIADLAESREAALAAFARYRGK